ncbi:MAG: hypothetical protein HOP29_02285 [Phycisphaerales bacterium]|nr:hypothetical protein [Phycisphaerales bacterium]
MIPTFRSAGVVLILVELAGCGRPWRGGVETAPSTAASTECDADALWESADGVLRDHDFDLDLVDRRGGRMTTHPVLSQHFFEFWRHDVATPQDRWEATMNPLRRWCEVRLQPRAEPDGGSVMSLTVHKERLSSPDRQFNSSAAGYHFFRDRLPAARTGMSIEPGEKRWIDAGRDPAMEQLLIHRILARSGAITATSVATKQALAEEPPERIGRPAE